MKRPEGTEYNPYYQHYIDLAGEGIFPDILRQNSRATAEYFLCIGKEKHNYKYAPGKWTIKEVLMHIIDTERVFAYRTLVCGRGDNLTPLPSMDSTLYASNIDVTNRPMHSLIDEFLIVRRNSEVLFEYLSETHSAYMGNGVTHNITARALGLIMIGHIKHHINIINERY